MNEQLQLAKRIAAALLQIGAIALRPQQPFVWTSGIQSPIYCDNRLTMSYPEIRRLIAEGFASIIRRDYPDAQVIAGTATAGIPHAAWAAELLQLPMIYVRDKAKGHGKQNLIEGRLASGQKTVVIEDLISTGGSSLKAAQAVNEAEGNALAVLAIFSYELERGKQAFAQQGIPLQVLSNYSILLDTAFELSYITAAELEMLREWPSTLT